MPARMSFKINYKLGNWIAFTLGFGTYLWLVWIFRLTGLLAGPFTPAS